MTATAAKTTTSKPTKTKAAAKPAPKSTPKTTVKPAAVLAYLKANPQFFEKHKEELAETAATPKKGRMGGSVLSLHAAKAERVTREADNLKVRHQQLISTARGNAEVAESIFSAVLGLIGCRNLTDLRKYLQGGLAEQLDLDAIRLFKLGETETATTLTVEQIVDLCPQPLVLGPMNAAKHRILFGPKTNGLKSVCLMALANDNGDVYGLLALGSADATRFHAGQATTLADFLRRATTEVLAHAA
ncbi:MAG: hypothetical protein DI585_03780 [Pseudomonas fluorescens]|nr:MAG: hypothetical protein DI585_03780 [Pseudomonas fluorescens]